MTTGLGRAATRGALWLGAANLLSKGSQILVTLALGIFLSAAEVGMATVAVALLNLGLVLQLGGVYDMIARTSEEPRAFAGTVATLSLGMSVVTAVVCVVFAPRITSWLGAPGAGTLLQVAALSLPFTAYAGVQMGCLHRDLDFRRRLIPDAGAALTGAVVTVVCAAQGQGAWSLVAGLITTAVLMPLLGMAVGVRIPLRASPEHARMVARWVSITGPGALIGLVLLNVDYLIVSRYLGEAATGVYSFAYRIAFVPYIMGAVVIGAVSFPVYARLAASDGIAAIAPALARFLHIVVALTGAGYLALALLADRVVVIGPQWSDSGPVLRVLAAYGVMLSVIVACHHALRAAGRPALYLLAQIFHVLTLVGIAMWWVSYGILGVAWAQVLAAGLALMLVLGMLHRLDLLRSSLGLALFRPAVAGAVVAAGYWLAGRAALLPPRESLPGAIVLGILVLVGYGGVLALVDRPLRAQALAAVGRGPADTLDGRAHERL